MTPDTLSPADQPIRLDDPCVTAGQKVLTSKGVCYRARGACAEHDMGGERPIQPGYRAFLRKIYMRRKSAGGARLEAKSLAHTPHTQCVEQSKSSDDGFIMDKRDDRVYLGTSIVDKYI